MRSAGLAALVVFAGCHDPAPAASPNDGVLDGVFPAGSVSLHIHCGGKGTPTVIFDSGAGSDGTDWVRVLPDVESFTRACVYDHAGVGYSGPAPKPHTIVQMVSELHALLSSAGERGPYVLVGHSLGGLNARLFAAEHPTEVAGLVLVDAATEWQDRVWGLLLPEQFHIWQGYLRDRSDGFNFEAFRESVLQLRAASRSLGAMPLIVLSSLSSNSVQVVSEKSGHFIQGDNPKLVVTAVHETVEAARTHQPVAKAPIAAAANSSY